MLNFIIWNLDPDIIDLGFPRIRYYGLMFVISFILGYYIFKVIFKRENQPEKWLDTLLWYMMLGIIVGARLGHCLFYQPEYYLANPIEILKVWEGGLASHGGAIGIVIALWLFSRNVAKKPLSWILDRIVIVVALGAFFIRMGNLANSEIYGEPTMSTKGFVYVKDTRLDRNIENNRDYQKYIEHIGYEKTDGEPIMDGKAYPLNLQVTMKRNIVDTTQVLGLMNFNIKPLLKYGYNEEGGESNLFLPDKTKPQISITKQDGRFTATMQVYAIPKHPTHIYEALAYLLTFIVLLAMYFLWGAGKLPGLMTGVLMVMVFVARFLIEYIKENQVAKETEMALNLGQKLSIPFVVIGLVLIILALAGKTKKFAAKY